MSKFPARVDETFDELLRRLERAAPEVEADLGDGVLTLGFPDESSMVLNRQEAVEQIWVASRLGPARFGFDPASGQWKDERSGETLTAAIERLLSAELSRPVRLD